MPFHPDNDDLLQQYTDMGLDPDEIPRCRHGVLLAIDGSTRDCQDCNEHDGQAQDISAWADTPFAVNH